MIPRFEARAGLFGEWRGAVIALGNFDGFHLGHQAVVGRAIARARSEGRKAIVATFDPHPMRYFRPDTPWFRLTTLGQRQRLFGAAGADAMLVFGFDRDLAETGAAAFMADLLRERLGAGGIVTGGDFTFGHKRGGGAALLSAEGNRHGFWHEAVGPVIDGGEAVSSSRIRAALVAGDPVEAERLMTRPFAVEGVVQHGDKNGRLLGYPTANLDMGHYLRPAYGVYAVTARLADEREVKGAANLGIRPQFDPPKELLEPHFFDFSGDLYGQRIEVALRHFLRREARFDGLDALKAQMAADCVRATELLGE